MSPKRPLPHKHRRKVPSELLGDLPSEAELVVIAGNAEYRGSAEHKRAPWEDLQPALKSLDASICPTSIKSRAEATGMLRAAIRAGNVAADWQSGMPKRVWYKGSKGTFEARLTDRPALESGKRAGYKAWPEENEDHLHSRPRLVKVCDES